MPEDVDSRPRKSDRPQPSELDNAYSTGYEYGKSEAKEAVTVKGPRGAKLSFSNDSQKIIVICITITGLVAIIERLRSASKTVSVASILVGSFVSGGILLGLSYALPEFASGLAIIAMLATVLDRGKPFWAVVESTSNRVALISGGSAIPTTGTTKLPDLSSSGRLPNGSKPLDSTALPDGSHPLSPSGGPSPYDLPQGTKLYTT